MLVLAGTDEKRDGMNIFTESNAVRADFPILQKRVYGLPLVYLDNAATTQKPVAVLNEIRQYYTDLNSNIHRGAHLLSEKASECYEVARETVRRFIHAPDAQEILFTAGTTASINLVAESYGNSYVQEGDEVIVSEMEHHSNIIPWQMLCSRKGAHLRVLPFDSTGRLCIELLDSMISEKTKMVAVTFVSNVTGVVNPVQEVIRIAHAHGVPVLVDGAQAVAHMSIDVQDFDSDFFAFSGHKMYASTGIGVLHAKSAWLKKMQPWQFGGGMISSVSFEHTTFANIPFKFEAGTPNIAGAISLGAAIRYMEAIGIDEICRHQRELLHYAESRLSELDRVVLYARGIEKCGLLSFNIDSVSPLDVAMLLDKMGIALRSGSHCAQPVMKHYGVTGTVRASFALYTTPEEIDSLVQGIKRAGSYLQGGYCHEHN